MENDIKCFGQVTKYCRRVSGAPNNLKQASYADKSD